MTQFHVAAWSAASLEAADVTVVSLAGAAVPAAGEATYSVSSGTELLVRLLTAQELSAALVLRVEEDIAIDPFSVPGLATGDGAFARVSVWRPVTIVGRTRGAAAATKATAAAADGDGDAAADGTLPPPALPHVIVDLLWHVDVLRLVDYSSGSKGLLPTPPLLTWRHVVLTGLAQATTTSIVSDVGWSPLVQVPLWFVAYNRSKILVQGHDVTMVVDKDELQFYAFWSGPFNSPIPAIAKEADWMRTRIFTMIVSARLPVNTRAPHTHAATSTAFFAHPVSLSQPAWGRSSVSIDAYDEGPPLPS